MRIEYKFLFTRTFNFVVQFILLFEGKLALCACQNDFKYEFSVIVKNVIAFNLVPARIYASQPCIDPINFLQSWIRHIHLR